jgi:hypothetical protein
MENKNCIEPEGKILQHLGNLRKMIVHNHELENLSEFVLHELCSGPCFHVDKAAYFINNPDFRAIRGITGYTKQVAQDQLYDRWNNQSQFIASMKNSDFNQKVRSCSQENFQKGHASEKSTVQKLAYKLEIENPAYHIWNLKHANQGLLIYESTGDEMKYPHSHLLDSLYYLSFCPVF